MRKTKIFAIDSGNSPKDIENKINSFVSSKNATLISINSFPVYSDDAKLTYIVVIYEDNISDSGWDCK